jgi:hypothetical protein
VAKIHPGYGAAHGFDKRLTVAPGQHTVCAYGLNQAGTPGGTSALGCRTVTVSGSPTGHLDSVTVTGMSVLAAGWAIDRTPPPPPGSRSTSMPVAGPRRPAWPVRT